jgi:hypothetical protein
MLHQPTNNQNIALLNKNTMTKYNDVELHYENAAPHVHASDKIILKYYFCIISSLSG